MSNDGFFFIKYWTSTIQNCQDHQKKRKERNSDVMWYLGCDPGTEKKKKKAFSEKNRKCEYSVVFS